MSYCRWSSDNHRCSVYCFESDAGFEVHVSAYRHEPPPPPVPAYGTVPEKEWLKAYHAQAQAIDASKSVPIGLSRDGETFIFATAAECAECLKSLKAEGYHVPQYAIDELLEEAADVPEVRV